MSVHPIDLARFFLGDPDQAYVLKRTEPNGCGTCVLTLVYSSGASAVLNMSANDPHVQEWVEISSSNQLISVRNLVDYQHWPAGQDPAATKNCLQGSFNAWRPEFAIPYQQADSLWAKATRERWRRSPTRSSPTALSHLLSTTAWRPCASLKRSWRLVMG